MAFDGSTPTSRAAVLDVPAAAPVMPPPEPPFDWKAPAGALPPGAEGFVNWPGCTRLHATPATVRGVRPARLGDDAGRPDEFVYVADVPAAASGILVLWPDEFRPVKAKPAAAIATREQSRAAGYEGDPCKRCGALMLVRNGACLKCDSCGETTGCS